MRLNLGCGSKKLDGYIGVDIKEADVMADIRKLPFDDGSADEILAVHVCEHFYMHEIVEVIKEWLRVLKPGGMMALELPCFDKIAIAIKNNSERNPEADRLIIAAIFGSPTTHRDGEPALHKWCWSKSDFKKMLEIAGAKEVRDEEPHYHVKARDMRFICTK